VAARLKRESRSRGASFKDTLNDLLRAALLSADNKPRRRTLRIKPAHMGYKPRLNYDNVESLLLESCLRVGICDGCTRYLATAPQAVDKIPNIYIPSRIRNFQRLSSRRSSFQAPRLLPSNREPGRTYDVPGH